MKVKEENNVIICSTNYNDQNIISKNKHKYLTGSDTK